MSLIEQVIPGWSVAYPPKHRDSSSASDKPGVLLAAGRIYPSWSLVYPQSAPTEPVTTDASRDPTERLLREVFG